MNGHRLFWAVTSLAAIFSITDLGVEKGESK